MTPTSENLKVSEWSKEVLTQLITLSNKCDQLSRENDQIIQDIKAVDNNLSKRIEKLEILLTGNGSPKDGIILKLDRVETKVEQIEKYVDDDKDNKKWLLRGIIGSIIGCVISVIIAIFKFPKS